MVLLGYYCQRKGETKANSTTWNYAINKILRHREKCRGDLVCPADFFFFQVEVVSLVSNCFMLLRVQCYQVN